MKVVALWPSSVKRKKKQQGNLSFDLAEIKRVIRPGMARESIEERAMACSPSHDLLKLNNVSKWTTTLV